MTSQDIYILPSDTLDLSTLNPAVSFTNNTTNSWTGGDPTVTTDATDSDLTTGATYRVYVVPWSDNGLANTSVWADVTVNAP